MNGLGAEIAKNVILGNAKQVTLHDTKTAKTMDLAAHFYLTPEVAAMSRAASIPIPRP